MHAHAHAHAHVCAADPAACGAVRPGCVLLYNAQNVTRETNSTHWTLVTDTQSLESRLWTACGFAVYIVSVSYITLKYTGYGVP